MQQKIHRLSSIRPSNQDTNPDSLQRSKTLNTDDRSRGQQILLQAQACYSAMSKFRADRQRNKRYNYGNQLSDIVTIDGVQMTEEEYIKKQGGVPFTNNLIRRLTRNIIGTYRQSATEPICNARDRNEQKQAETLTTILQYNLQLNNAPELNARSLEEFLISGLTAQKITFGWRGDRLDCWQDIIPPDNLILDPHMRDLRSWDCSLIGQIHDLPFSQICNQLAKSPENYNQLAKIYSQARNILAGTYSWEQFGYEHHTADTNFLLPHDPALCRVIEIWRKETKPRYHCYDPNSGQLFKIETSDLLPLVINENNRRLQAALQSSIPPEETPLIRYQYFIDSYWYFYYLSPMGDILLEGETPYLHKSHPYVFKAYPFIDGEIHAFVSDIIDQQRQINHLSSLNDLIMRSSSKGLLLVPRGSMGNLTEQQIANTWARPGGVLIVDPDRQGNLPHQISSSAVNIGINEALATQLKFLEDISGINNALQGKPNFSGESGSHAQIMAQNSTASIADTLETFNDFQTQIAYKTIKTIQQYYTTDKILNIVGQTADTTTLTPQKILTTEIDTSVNPGKKTPVYRALANDFYMALFQQQAINVEQLLQSVSDIPFADELLQSIRSQRQQAQQGQTPQNLPPQLIQQAQQTLPANPQATTQLQQIIKQ